MLAEEYASPAFYFLPRFCGARCDSADAATLRTGLLVLGVRSTLMQLLPLVHWFYDLLP